MNLNAATLEDMLMAAWDRGARAGEALGALTHGAEIETGVDPEAAGPPPPPDLSPAAHNGTPLISQDPLPRLATYKQLAAFLGTTPGALMTRKSKGTLAGVVKDPGGCVRIDTQVYFAAMKEETR